jgi:hypothetical protein
MTAVSILRFDFKEIKIVRIVCETCKTEISIPLDCDLRKYLECPGCNTHLWGDGHQSNAYNATFNMINAIRYWNQQEDAKFTVGFSLPQ